MAKVHKIKTLSFFAFVAAALIFTGCGSGSATPEDVAIKYAQAWRNQDYDAMRKVSTNKEIESINKSEKEWNDLPPNKKEEKKELIKEINALIPEAEEPAQISESGNEAEVKIALKRKADDGKKPIVKGIKISLIKENDTWKVDKEVKAK